jgi:hypothetical protein
MWILAATVGGGCRRTHIDSVGRYHSSIAYGLVTAHATADGGRALAVVGVIGPDSDATPICRSWSYGIREQADLIWAWPGDYQMSARVSPVGHPDFFISGRVTVEDSKCYLPAMTCDSRKEKANACRLVLEPRKCAGIWFPARSINLRRRCEPR